MLRVGIYRGKFAPIHVAHVEAAKAFMSQMWLDVLFVIPTWQSGETGDGVSDKDRIEMCRRAFEGVEGVIISDIELRGGENARIIDTLRSFSCEDRRLFALCGTDVMLALDEWHDADEIFRLCYPVYARREKDRALDAKIIEKNTKYFEKFGKYVIKLDTPVINISSSELRKSCREGEDVSRFIAPEVLKYINEKGLYR